MKITVVINKCNDCIHFEYFGTKLNITPIPLCYHPDLKGEENDHILQDNLQIPERCPLKHSAKY